MARPPDRNRVSNASRERIRSAIIDRDADAAENGIADPSGSRPAVRSPRIRHRSDMIETFDRIVNGGRTPGE